MKQQIKDIMFNNEAIIFPTDTVYGIGCIPSKEAIENLYKIKNRDKNKKIIALVSDYEYIKDITDEIDMEVVKKYLPGALTIVCKSNNKFKSLVGETIGIRIPKLDMARDIIRECGGILMTTSANISGEPSAKHYSELSKEILDKVNIVIKTEDKLSGIPSTIISYIDKKYGIIRQGEIIFNI